ncbi:NAD-dependent epimerase/dehydratase family protein [bacterium]|nr:NAD-dependent epimerase/dehydratase family protein [bacterium]
MRVLVTGATGFLGSHVAETLAGKGWQVRAIARSAGKTRLLQGWGVDIIAGDLADATAVRRSCVGVNAVVHCAAKVGDWGPVDEYRKINVDALRVLMDAALAEGVARFVLVSSLGVYEARDHHGTDEATPLPAAHIDGYTQTKVEAENLAMTYYREKKLPLIIIRPGFIYGPRDETVMPRILANLKARLVTYFGSREKRLNNVYVGNVVEAIELALDPRSPLGEAFNITDPETVTKKVFFERIADLAGLPRPLATWPMWFARFMCSTFEAAGKALNFQPVLSMARLKFMGLNLDYSIAKAKKTLGYVGQTSFDEGMAKTIDWLRQQGKVTGTARPVSHSK